MYYVGKRPQLQVVDLYNKKKNSLFCSTYVDNGQNNLYYIHLIKSKDMDSVVLRPMWDTGRGCCGVVDK